MCREKWKMRNLRTGEEGYKTQLHVTGYKVQGGSTTKQINYTEASFPHHERAGRNNSSGVMC